MRRFKSLPSKAHNIWACKRQGSIEVGKLADLIVIDGDVLADLKRPTVQWTILGGRVYEAFDMDPVWPAGTSRPSLYFQESNGTPPTRTETQHCGCSVP